MRMRMQTGKGKGEGLGHSFKSTHVSDTRTPRSEGPSDHPNVIFVNLLCGLLAVYRLIVRRAGV